jgi:hypothetical protein
MDDIYYYEAVNDVNLHCEEYTEKHVRPQIWRDLVKEQINYLNVLNQLSMYLFDNDNIILKMFSHACVHYDDDTAYNDELYLQEDNENNEEYENYEGDDEDNYDSDCDDFTDVT